jgi:hypothetical protein
MRVMSIAFSLGLTLMLWRAASGESRLAALKRRFARFLPLILVGAISGSLVATNQSHASDSSKHVTSIAFGEQTIDSSHAMRWHGWKIGFGTGRPFGEFNSRGMAVRGLWCASSRAAPVKCRLFLSMKPVESFAHFCEMLPDDRHARGPWPLRIDCPNEIKFDR